MATTDDARPKLHCNFDGPKVPQERDFREILPDLKPVRLSDPLESDRHIRLLLLRPRSAGADEISCGVFQIHLDTLKPEEFISKRPECKICIQQIERLVNRLDERHIYGEFLSRLNVKRNFDERHELIHDIGRLEIRRYDNFDENLMTLDRLRLAELFRELILEGLKCEEKERPWHGPRFSALSYRWGNAKENRSIHCGYDEKEIPIRSNLWEALNAVRFDDRQRLIWVDALCINQTDTEERNKQVRLMSEIYSNAHVCVWLGSSCVEGRDDHVQEFLKMLWKVGKIFSTLSHAPTSGVRKRLLKFARESGVHDPQQLPWIELTAFLANEYFSRVWICQEIILARHVAVYHGSYVVPMESVTIAYGVRKRLRSQGLQVDGEPHHLQLLKLGDFENSISMAEGLVVMAMNREPSPITLRFPQYFISGLLDHQNCTDPRDRVYGLLSLLRDGANIPVDYNLTPVEVFADYTLHCIREAGDLAFLSFGCRQVAYCCPDAAASMKSRTWLEGLPSWCPDLNGPQQVGRELGLSERNMWCASSGKALDITTSSRSHLGLMGVALGSVNCSDNIYFGSSVDSFCLGVLSMIPARRLWQRCIESLFVRRSDSSEEEDEQMRDILPRGYSCDSIERVKVTLAEFWSAKYAPKLHRAAGIKTPRGRRSTRSRIADAVSNLMSERNRRGKLFLSYSGHLGSCLCGARAGDQLCILYGGKLPYIVRPHGDGKHYTFICEAYAPGLMYGEALELGLPEQEFVLV